MKYIKNVEQFNKNLLEALDSHLPINWQLKNNKIWLGYFNSDEDEFKIEIKIMDEQFLKSRYKITNKEVLKSFEIYTTYYYKFFKKEGGFFRTFSKIKSNKPLGIFSTIKVSIMLFLKEIKPDALVYTCTDEKLSVYESITGEIVKRNNDYGFNSDHKVIDQNLFVLGGPNAKEEIVDAILKVGILGKD